MHHQQKQLNEKCNGLGHMIENIKQANDKGEDRAMLSHMIDNLHQQFTEIKRESDDLDNLIAAAGQCTCTNLCG